MTTKKTLGRQDILKADDLGIEIVEVPEWGGVVRVRGLTGEERDLWESEVADARYGENRQGQPVILRNARARRVARCVVDEDGKRVFRDADIKALGQKSGRALDRVFDVAAALSGISEAEVEDIRKNLRAASSGNSPSD